MGAAFAERSVWGGRALRACAGLVVAVALLVPSPAGAGSPVPTASGPLRVFAAVPPPGQPEGIAVDPRDGSVWTGSNRAAAPARLWHFDRRGRLIGKYDLVGHDPRAPLSVNGITLDGAGNVYALDYSGARAVRLDPRTGRQRVYATFPDLPLCLTLRTPCEPSLLDRQAWPNWATFDAHGNMYVSDLYQATIWKVPPGGGVAKIWYQNADFASIYSLNGMQFDSQGRLNFILTLSTQLDGLARGAIYRIAVKPDGSPGALTKVAVSGIASDGLAISASGNIYVCVTNQIPVPGLPKLLPDFIEVYSPAGRLLAQLPTAAQQQRDPTVLDSPASVAFRGHDLLITNQSRNLLDPAHFAVLDLPVSETGLPLHYPELAPSTRRNP